MCVTTVTIALVVLFQGVVATIDLQYLDETVDPCDDFEKFACGNFGKYHTRPDNQQTLDGFTLTTEDLLKIGQEILSSPKRDTDPVALKKAKSAYTSCVDVPNIDSYVYYQLPEKYIIEEFGGMPLVTDEAVEQISFSQIGEIAGKFGIPQIFQFLVANSNPSNYMILMFTESESTPSMIRPRTIETYDKVLEESLKKVSKVPRKLEEDPLDVFFLQIGRRLLNMHNMLNEEKLRQDINDIKKFMAQLYNKGIVDDDMVPLNDSATLGELQSWTDKQFGDDINMDWVEYFQQHFKWANVNITEDFVVYLVSPESVYGVLNLIRKTDPRVIKNYILFKTFLYMAPDSDFPVRSAFEEYYKSLGFPYYNRTEYCTRKILDVVDSVSLSFAVINDFVRYHFNINKIPEAVKVIQNTKNAFKDTLSSIEWLDDESRDAVVKKLDNIVVYLGYPQFVDNRNSLDYFYDNVRICEWDNYGNARRIRAFKQAYTLSEFAKHDLWTMSPFEVNAYAVRAKNRIMSPVSILQPFFFNGSDVVFDYSRYGTIIAHEFIHHFDSRGISYNESGFSEPLLSTNSTDLFHEKLQCFVDQYNKFYVPEVGEYINGSRTLDENIADNGGVNHALAAFLKWKQENPVQNVSDKYTLEQLFFINYAGEWCSDDSSEYLTKLVKGNDHTPNRYRILGTLANIDEFSQAFNCPVGSKMNPEIKCNLW